LTVSKENLGNLKDQIEGAMKGMPDFDMIKDQVKMTVAGEGLRIELMETEKGLFFERGLADPSTNGKDVLIMLAQELGKLPNHIMVEGHTDSRPFTNRKDYSNWELSADRANAARRIMLESGLRPDQVKQIRGYADQRLLKPDAPEDPSNRRISVIVQYLNPPAQPGSEPGKSPLSSETPGHPQPGDGARSGSPRK
jgi:chemotaxis protein MotB